MYTQPTTANISSAPPRQALSFAIGAENYAVNLLQVQEIRCWTPVTRIPQSPPHVLGVLNLRGNVVPVFDLRIHFGAANPAYAPTNVVIVLSIPGADGPRECGVVVDSVADVIDLPMDGLMPPPTLQAGEVAECISGLFSSNGQLIMLLDIGALITRDLLGKQPYSEASFARPSNNH